RHLSARAAVVASRDRHNGRGDRPARIGSGRRVHRILIPLMHDRSVSGILDLALVAQGSGHRRDPDGAVAAVELRGGFLGGRHLLGRFLPPRLLAARLLAAQVAPGVTLGFGRSVLGHPCLRHFPYIETTNSIGHGFRNPRRSVFLARFAGRSSDSRVGPKWAANGILSWHFGLPPTHGLARPHIAVPRGFS